MKEREDGILIDSVTKANKEASDAGGLTFWPLPKSIFCLGIVMMGLTAKPKRF